MYIELLVAVITLACRWDLIAWVLAGFLSGCATVVLLDRYSTQWSTKLPTMFNNPRCKLAYYFWLGMLAGVAMTHRLKPYWYAGSL